MVFLHTPFFSHISLRAAISVDLVTLGTGGHVERTGMPLATDLGLAPSLGFLPATGTALGEAHHRFFVAAESRCSAPRLALCRVVALASRKYVDQGEGTHLGREKLGIRLVIVLAQRLTQSSLSHELVSDVVDANRSGISGWGGGPGLVSFVCACSLAAVICCAEHRGGPVRRALRQACFWYGHSGGEGLSKRSARHMSSRQDSGWDSAHDASSSPSVSPHIGR